MLPGSRLDLPAGELWIESAAPFRLRWAPEFPEALLDERFARPQDLFPNVYSY